MFHFIRIMKMFLEYFENGAGVYDKMIVCNNKHDIFII